MLRGKGSSPLTHARIVSSVIVFPTAFYPSTSIPEQLTMAAAYAFADIMSYEDTLKKAKFNSIVGAKNKWRFLKVLSALTVGASEEMSALTEVQIEILYQVTNVKLESTGVTQEVAEVAMRKKELEVVGSLYKSSVRKCKNNMQTIKKYWGLGWVEEFGEFYPPCLPVDENENTCLYMSFFVHTLAMLLIGRFH